MSMQCRGYFLSANLVDNVRFEPEVQLGGLGICAEHVVVDLLAAPLSMNALNVAIPRLTCSDTQCPGWLEVYFGNGVSCVGLRRNTLCCNRCRATTGGMAKRGLLSGSVAVVS